MKQIVQSRCEAMAGCGLVIPECTLVSTNALLPFEYGTLHIMKQLFLRGKLLQDQRAGNADIYGQILDFEGNLLYGNDGLAIAYGDNDQQNPTISFNSVENEFMVCWEDFNGIDFNTKIFPIWYSVTILLDNERPNPQPRFLEVYPGSKIFLKSFFKIPFPLSQKSKIRSLFFFVT